MTQPTPPAIVHVPGGDLSQGSLQQVDAEGALISFDLETAPAIALRQEVDLEVRVPGRADAVVVRGMVVQRCDAASTRDYKLWFLDPEEVQRAALPLLRPLFNRRCDARMTLPPGVTVDVELEARPSGVASRARLIDVSAGGVNVELDPGTNPDLVESPGVVARFTLPTWSDEVELVGVIRHREVTGATVRIGIELDDEGTECAAAKHEVLEDFVRRRQRELMGRALEG